MQSISAPQTSPDTEKKTCFRNTRLALIDAVLQSLRENGISSVPVSLRSPPHKCFLDDCDVDWQQVGDSKRLAEMVEVLDLAAFCERNEIYDPADFARLVDSYLRRVKKFSPKSSSRSDSSCSTTSSVDLDDLQHALTVATAA